MYVYANPNPKKLITGDCVIRAISLAEGKSWQDVYVDLFVEGYIECQFPDANGVWGQYLIDKGYEKHSLPDTCPMCYTLKEFCEDHPDGTYIVGTGTHAVCVIKGDIFDTWDSSATTPLYYFIVEDE